MVCWTGELVVFLVRIIHGYKLFLGLQMGILGCALCMRAYYTWGKTVSLEIRTVVIEPKSVYLSSY